jgi:thyroxine 5-deiodinase
LQRLIDVYKSSVNFLIVYVMEAHGSDEWPLGLHRSSTRQHKTIDERLTAATGYRAQVTDSLRTNVTWAIDTMHNDFYSCFGGWPEVHLIISATGTLLLRTESNLGEGTVKGGEWDVLVEEYLVQSLKV